MNERGEIMSVTEYISLSVLFHVVLTMLLSVTLTFPNPYFSVRDLQCNDKYDAIRYEMIC